MHETMTVPPEHKRAKRKVYVKSDGKAEAGQKSIAIGVGTPVRRPRSANDSRRRCDHGAAPSRLQSPNVNALDLVLSPEPRLGLASRGDALEVTFLPRNIEAFSVATCRATGIGGGRGEPGLHTAGGECVFHLSSDDDDDESLVGDGICSISGAVARKQPPVVPAPLRTPLRTRYDFEDSGDSRAPAEVAVCGTRPVHNGSAVADPSGLGETSRRARCALYPSVCVVC